ncbi:MAG: outer membrane beta-barrel protein [Bacteroidota bacterium]
MKNFTIILFFLSISAFCQGQDIKFKKWLIGVSYEANISSRQLKYSASNEWVKHIRNNSELPRYGFSTGGNFRYNLDQTFSIETGLLFANRGFATKKHQLNWATPNFDFPITSETAFAFYYIEVPLKINFNFALRKLRMYASTGVSMNYFVNRNTTLLVYNNNGDKQKTKSQQKYGYTKDTYSILLGFGMNITISKRVLLNIEPIYIQNFTSITADNKAKEYLYSFGLNTKFFLNLKRNPNK